MKHKQTDEQIIRNMNLLFKITWFIMPIIFTMAVVLLHLGFLY